MWERLRRRTAGEDGITLVEILIAVFLLTVGLFALLGSFVTSAQSLHEQEGRSVATRVATETLESLRTSGFDAVPVGTTTSQVVRGALTFDIETVVEWRDASGWQTGAAEDVKLATVTVDWETRGQDRSVVFSTAISQLGRGDLTSGGGSGNPAIMTVGVSPDPVLAATDGTASEDVQLRATLEDFETIPMVVAKWINHGTGLEETEVLTTTDQIEWRANVDGSRFHLPPSGDEVVVTFEAVEYGLERTYPLRMQDPSAPSPAFTSTSISQTPITVNTPHSNKGCDHPVQNCRNTQAITFAADVTGLDPANVDSVKVRYLRRDGSQGELALLQDPSDPETWSKVLDANLEQFKPGTDMTFTFIVTSVTDGVSSSQNLTRTVAEV